MASGGKPAWLKVRPPSGDNYVRLKETLRGYGLYTVCEEARCPNVSECWGGGTATFMILGGTCTRGCRFCSVQTGNPHGWVDALEPQKVARAIRSLGLTYAVITSVDRDDLPDGGAAHFARTVRSIREENPEVFLEVLIPDFQGDAAAVTTVVDAGAHVVAHNLETVRRLTPKVRDPRATYDQSLSVLKSIKERNPSIFTKSSIMLGLGEKEEELRESMDDLRRVGTDILTLGQYLQPTPRHLPVLEYVAPETYDALAEEARKLGFLYVASGPLVRSSYRAGEFFLEAILRRREGGEEVELRSR